MTAPQAIADHFNATGVTTRKGRRWTGATVAKFLSSPGAKRYRSGGKAVRTVKPKGNPDKPSNALDKAQLRRISEITIGHYDRTAEDYRDGTRNHDVSQNYEALLEAIEGEPPYAILDLGCGPGRDLRYFRSLGHDATGLDGSMELVSMARRYSGCDVLHQDFLAMKLPASRFDGVFANAALFHVPSQELPRVLGELRAALKPRGVLFCSNPRGRNEEGWSGDRYSCFFDLRTWRALARDVGFLEVTHYYRPPGLPRDEQMWLATVWRKG
ncbi:MAG: methyltransferase domain-containing protein [Proteobacteria bacterium]|nr:methyltransferase domain-containing protein [Pseudomonadota bacterium]